MLLADAIVKLHDESTAAWHALPTNKPDALTSDPWLARVARQHHANFNLWHIEDEARTPGATDAQLANVKRRIDKTNQLDWLAPQRLPAESAELHSESPGLIIDRLSILALKIYHTREEAERTDSSPGHTERNRQRLAILDEQRADLARCLDVLWRATLDGTRRFKLYRQLKMYNDPALNPAIYRSTLSEPGP
jgi:hypothetical protein